MVDTTNHNMGLRSIILEERLNGSNFFDWYRKLRIILKHERKEYVLRKPLPERIGANRSHAVYDAWEKHYTDVKDVRSLMLGSMDSDLREQYEKVESPVDIITSLRNQSQAQAGVERYDTVKSLIRCRLQEGKPVGRHINVILGHIKYLDELGYPLGTKMTTLIILQSLPSSFDGFVRNYVKRGLRKSVAELFDMLKKAEVNIKKGTGFKKPGKDKGGNKAIQISDRDRPMCSVRPKSGPSFDCSFCKEQGHLVTSCNRFLEGLD